MKLVGIPFDELTLGQSASYSKKVSAEDLDEFAEVTGDNNPMHLDPEFAEKTIFGGCIAHGMLIGSFISTVLGTRLPGPGTIYLSQSFEFFKPVYPNDTITTTVTVAEKQNRKRIKMDCVCTNQDGVEVIKGQAIVLAPRNKTTWRVKP